MCLSSVKETYDSPSTLIVDGWKEFAGTSTKPQFQNFPHAGSTTVQLDTWLEITGTEKIVAGDGKKYDAGFHAYSDEKDLKMDRASTRPYRRVFLRRITCLGMQELNKCVIAQEMYVPSDPNGWPPKPDPVDMAPPSNPSTPVVKKGKMKDIMERFKGMKPGEA